MAVVVVDSILLILGRAIAQMVSRRVITTDTRIQSHASPFVVENVALGSPFAPIIILRLLPTYLKKDKTVHGLILL